MVSPTDEINVDKYVEVLQFLLDEETGANNQHLGKVKLMKLLYFADFDHFVKHGKSITGDTYVKLDYGPVPKHGSEMLDILAVRELIDIGEAQLFDYVRNVYSLRKPLMEINHLTADEVATLTAVVNKWKYHTRQEIVSASHGDPPWQLTGYGEEIDYKAAFFRRNVVLSEADEEPEPMPINPSQRVS